MKIALGQLKIYWEDKKKNLEKIESCMQILEKKGTDMFLLPEMSLTGFSMHTERTKEQMKETVSEIGELVCRYHLAVGVGWVKDAGTLCENHYSIVTPYGEILDYTKIHPFRYGGETVYFQGGCELPVCEYEDFSLGVQICYDLRFPEAFQCLSKSAELIIVPANWPAARREHWMCLLRARAIENLCYVAGVNCAGTMGGQYYSGDSGIYAPDGTLLPGEIVCLQGACPEEKVLCFELENDVHQYRMHFPAKEDRREALYSQLLSRRE